MTPRERLERMPVASPIWAQRYPELLTIWEEEAAAPKGNIGGTCVRAESGADSEKMHEATSS